MGRKFREDPMLLTDLELELMKCLWEKGDVSAAALQIQMVRKGTDIAYTTVKLILDRLTKHAICVSKEIDGRHYYKSLISRDEIASRWLHHLNKKIFVKV
jgi:BlaI family transcriptional regulator, penicillinase repressor